MRTYSTDTLFLSINDVSVKVITNPIVMDTYSQASISVKISDAVPLDGLLSLQLSNKYDSDFKDIEESIVSVTKLDTYIYNIQEVSYRYLRVVYEPYVGTPDLEIQITRKA